MTRRTFYSKTFNISLIAVALIVAAIIVTIQLSVVVSLGMVGALSIVRFRTAVKDPMDLVLLFWAISVGIICGAGIPGIAISLSLMVTIVLLIFDRIPVAKTAMILVINGDFSDGSIDQKIEEIVEKYCKFYSEKSRNIADGQLNLVLEI